MEFIRRIIGPGARTALAFAVAVPLAFSQMGGGMGGGMGSGSGMPGGSGTSGSGMPGSGAGGGMLGGGMPGGMMGAGMEMAGPAVGPDGTAYVLRRTVVTTQANNTLAQVKTELVAINVKDGNAKWTLGIDGWMVSEPAFGKDGRIFVTTSAGGASTAKSALLVVIADQLSARIANRVEVGADVLSAPRIASDDAGYVVYVIASEMGRGMMDTDATSDSQAGSTLYAFLPDGREKFKVQLFQGTGSPGPR